MHTLDTLLHLKIFSITVPLSSDPLKKYLETQEAYIPFHEEVYTPSKRTREKVSLQKYSI